MELTGILCRLIVFMTVLFHQGILAQMNSNKSFLTVGYLMADTSYNGFVKNKQGRVISGAVTLAIQEIRNNAQLLPNHDLRFIYSDTNADVLNGTRKLTEQWKAGAVAFFGPEDSCDVEARVAAAWNLPMISYKCTDHKVSDKTLYPTFARTSPPATQVTKSILALLMTYSWRRFTMVVSSNAQWQSIAEKLTELSALHNLTLNGHFDFTEDLMYSLDDPFPDIVKNSYIDTRVYVYLGYHDGLQDLLSNLDKRHLLESGDYIVIHTDLGTYDTKKRDPSYYFKHTYAPVNDQLNVNAARALLVIVSTPPSNPNYTRFTDYVDYYDRQEPFNFPGLPPIFAGPPDFGKKKITIYAAYLYDAIYLYARALHELLEEGGHPRDGRSIISKILGRSYKSIQGNLVYINGDGDAEGNYTVLSRMSFLSAHSNYSMNPVGHFQIGGNHTNELPKFTLLNGHDILWVNGEPPSDEPRCGYRGEKCILPPNYTKEIALGVFGGIGFIVAVIILIVYRNWRYEQEIAGLLWKINIDDIQGLNKTSLYGSKATLGSNGSYDSRVSLAQVFTLTGSYKGQVVALKKYTKRNLDIGRKEKKEMKLMKDLRHDNVNAFIGACVDPPELVIVTEYCAKGSLQDILENEDVKLDSMFVSSLVMDLIKGMTFLHDSELHCHGNLKSSNCVVNSRWSLQVADFGLIELRQSTLEDENEYALFRNKLWTAPELIRAQPPPKEGTQKADVYAFGIILYEILGRSGPFGDIDLSPKDIITRVQCTRQWPSFRPDTTVICCQDYIKRCMIECWQEQPEIRPDFRTVRTRLKPMRQGMKTNIFDNMVAMMEKYQSHLEEIVAERTELLMEEKKKTEGLLHRMLPKSVADQLVGGQAVQPESFQSVTIYFSDICGFTSLSAVSTPMQMVDMLNDLYTLFDSIIAHYDVYKVETIGDAYMVVSGLPIRNGDNHAGEIASMSLSLLTAIKSFRIRHRPEETLKLRIGVHSGPCVAGVVGLTMPRYCLFGDTVNTSSRMESNGEALKIHVSSQCKEILDKLGGYTLEARGTVNMKGKGEVFTYWLLSENAMVRLERLTGQHKCSDHSLKHKDSLRKSVRISDCKKGELAGGGEAGTFFDLIRDSDNSTTLRGKGLKRTPSLSGYHRRRSHDSRSISKELVGANGFLQRHGEHGKIPSPTSKKKQDSACRSPKLLPSIVVDGSREDSDTLENIAKETDKLLDNRPDSRENPDHAQDNSELSVFGEAVDIAYKTDSMDCTTNSECDMKDSGRCFPLDMMTINGQAPNPNSMPKSNEVKF